MTPTFENFHMKKFIGFHLEMSLTNNKTEILWKKFMEKRKSVPNVIGEDFYSIQIFPQDYFLSFQPQVNFIKHAMIEVSDFKNKPEDMASLTIENGLYAVFNYQGLPEEASPFFEKIFTAWLPQSGYKLSNRAHFEVLGSEYKKGSPLSKEKVWIPIEK